MALSPISPRNQCFSVTILGLAYGKEKGASTIIASSVLPLVYIWTSQCLKVKDKVSFLSIVYQS